MSRAIAWWKLGLVVLIATSVTRAESDPAKCAAQIAPLIESSTLVVAHADLERINITAVLEHWRRLSGGNGEVDALQQQGQALLDQLRAAKATDLFLLVNPTDLPAGGPVIAIAGDKTGHEAIVHFFAQVAPDLKAEPLHGLVVAAAPFVLERLRTAAIGNARPELPLAWAAASPSDVQLAILPDADTRRAVGEMLLVPEEFGGISGETLANGLRWATLAVETSANFRVGLTVQSEDTASAQAFASGVVKVLERLAQQPEVQAVVPTSQQLVAALQPRVQDSRVHFVLVQQGQQPGQGLDLLAPIKRAREAARRTQCMNNLKQLALAMHNSHDSYRRFPAAAIRDKDGKALLSWRVHLLPFLEQEPLYKEFHLDEPWDSEHNKKLIARIPKLYVCPSGPPELLQKGLTTYLVPVGDKGLFGGKDGPQMRDITDGTSNTIMIVDASPESAVVWTKPDDLEIDPQQPFKGLISQHEGGFLAAFADGSVQFLAKALAAETLQLLFDPRDGKPIPR